MKPGKIISLDNYRALHHGAAKKTLGNAAGIPLPSADRLWVLLDRNISIAFWREQN